MIKYPITLIWNLTLTLTEYKHHNKHSSRFTHIDARAHKYLCTFPKYDNRNVFVNI